MQKPPQLEKAALSLTRWIGSTQSIIVHTIIFILSFSTVLFGFFSFDRMLLVLTTILSLEAIYLALFIQMTVNYTTASVEAVHEDIEDIQEDVGEMQEDVEEIQKDVDELQEDVEEMSEEEVEEEKREADHQKTLDTIQADLRKLLSDIERLKTER